jgi:hypothetical protein
MRDLVITREICLMHCCSLVKKSHGGSTKDTSKVLLLKMKMAEYRGILTFFIIWYNKPSMTPSMLQAIEKYASIANVYASPNRNYKQPAIYAMPPGQMDKKDKYTIYHAV